MAKVNIPLIIGSIGLGVGAYTFLRDTIVIPSSKDDESHAKLLAEKFGFKLSSFNEKPLPLTKVIIVGGWINAPEWIKGIYKRLDHIEYFEKFGSLKPDGNAFNLTNEYASKNYNLDINNLIIFKVVYGVSASDTERIVNRLLSKPIDEGCEIPQHYTLDNVLRTLNAMKEKFINVEFELWKCKEALRKEKFFIEDTKLIDKLRELYSDGFLVVKINFTGKVEQPPKQPPKDDEQPPKQPPKDDEQPPKDDEQPPKQPPKDEPELLPTTLSPKSKQYFDIDEVIENLIKMKEENITQVKIYMHTEKKEAVQPFYFIDSNSALEFAKSKQRELYNKGWKSYLMLSQNAKTMGLDVALNVIRNGAKKFNNAKIGFRSGNGWGTTRYKLIPNTQMIEKDLRIWYDRGYRIYIVKFW